MAISAPNHLSEVRKLTTTLAIQTPRKDEQNRFPERDTHQIGSQRSGPGSGDG